MGWGNKKKRFIGGGRDRVEKQELGGNLKVWGESAVRCGAVVTLEKIGVGWTYKRI